MRNYSSQHTRPRLGAVRSSTSIINQRAEPDKLMPASELHQFFCEELDAIVAAQAQCLQQVGWSRDAVLTTVKEHSNELRAACDGLIAAGLETRETLRQILGEKFSDDFVEIMLG